LAIDGPSQKKINKNGEDSNISIATLTYTYHALFTKMKINPFFYSTDKHLSR
jgi:hypothetical protein